MAGKVLNAKAFSPVKLHSDLAGKYHAICHYSYNLPLQAIKYLNDKLDFTYTSFI